MVGLVEAMPECGGYKVHRDKLARLGVPIYTSHTVVSANGTDAVESVTIARVDEQFRPVAGTERSFDCDTLLIAVGLDPVDEFYDKAREFGLAAFAAGDAEEIAEASAAIFSGKIRGLEVARALGHDVGEISPDWYRTADILKSQPGSDGRGADARRRDGRLPGHPLQPGDPLRSLHGRLPQRPHRNRRARTSGACRASSATKAGKGCTGCEKCVAICPGLAITLVDYRKDPDFPTVAIPFEFLKDSLKAGDRVVVEDTGGERARPGRGRRGQGDQGQRPDRHRQGPGAQGVCQEDRRHPDPGGRDRRAPGPIRRAGPRTTPSSAAASGSPPARSARLIREGVRDINEIKAVTRAGMGSCGAKTCTPLVHRLFREEGVAEAEIVDQPKRPLFVEVPLGVFAGFGGKDEGHDGE